MPLHPSYAILGNGRWARTIHGILATQSKVAMLGETRRRPQENETEYAGRIATSLAITEARVVWICVPPSPNTPLMVAAALASGMHVIVEKPWLWPAASLAEEARARGLVVGIHHEYCLLDAVEGWRGRQQAGAGLLLSGRFTTSGSDRLGIPAIENLGSHLFAIRTYAVPKAEIARIDCAYNQPDRRVVTLSQRDQTIAEIDFTANREPIIQRYISYFESATETGEFPLGLDFAVRVMEALNEFKAQA